MLTKNDLKQIGNVIDERLEVKLEEKLESKLEEKLESKLEEKLESKLEEKLEPIKKDLKSLKKDVRYLKKTVNVIVASFDEADVKLQRRVRKIERHLALPEEN